MARPEITIPSAKMSVRQSKDSTKTIGKTSSGPALVRTPGKSSVPVINPLQSHLGTPKQQVQQVVRQVVAGMTEEQLADQAAKFAHLTQKIVDVST